MFPKRFNFVLNYIRIEFFVTSRLREKNKTYVLFITRKKTHSFLCMTNEHLSSKTDSDASVYGFQFARIFFDWSKQVAINFQQHVTRR